MKKILVIAIAATFAGTALATDQGVGGNATDSVISSGQANNNSSTTYNGFSAAEVQDIADEAFARGQQAGEASRGLETINQNIKYSGEYKLKNTPNVSAPALTTTMTETCMGSSSVGGAVPGFGLSFGTTWRDSACVRRLDARELNSLGYRLGAKELMCDSDAVRAALLRAGTPCREDIAELPPVAPAVVPAEEAPARGYNQVDEKDAFAWQNM